MKFKFLPYAAVFILAAVGFVSTPEQNPGKPEQPAVKKELEAKVKLIPPDKETSPFLTNRNFIMDWTILGPFTFKETDFGGEKQAESVDKEFMSDESNLDCKTTKPPEGLSWLRITGTDKGNTGHVDFNRSFGKTEHAAVYCVCLLEVPEDMDKIQLRIGCDDYMKIWINGKSVFAYNSAPGGADWDQHIVKDISLKKGLNRIVVKCMNITYDWEMCIRFTDSTGLPFRGEESK